MSAPELSTTEQARVAAFEAAEEPEEILLERVAMAMWDASHGLPWSHAEFRAEADEYRAMAKAAIAVLIAPVQEAIEAHVQRVTRPTSLRPVGSGGRRRDTISEEGQR